MMSNNAPSVVWLENDPAYKFTFEGLCYAFPTKEVGEDDAGPYVNLDWFLGEVERRALMDAQNHADADGRNIPYPDEDIITIWFRESAGKLAKEIKEGALSEKQPQLSDQDPYLQTK